MSRELAFEFAERDEIALRFMLAYASTEYSAQTPDKVLAEMAYETADAYLEKRAEEDARHVEEYAGMGW